MCLTTIITKIALYLFTNNQKVENITVTHGAIGANELVYKSVLEKKHEKWQKVMYEASKQCERAKVPTCFDLTTLDEVLSKDFDKIMILAERSTEISFKEYLRENEFSIFGI